MPDYGGMALALFGVVVVAALLVCVGWIAGYKRGGYDAMDKLYRGMTRLEKDVRGNEHHTT